jgi:hypothetical protein
MTIYARGPRRRTEPPRQPLARAALALLPSPTRTRGQPRRRMAARTLGSRADPGHGEPSVRGDDRQTAQTASHPPLRRRFRGQHVVQAAGACRRRNSRSRERLTGPGELRTVDPVAVRLARRKTECWANVSQCPVYVDSRRLLCANGGHSAAVWRAGQIDPKHAFPSWTRYGRSAPESSRRRYGQDSLSKLRTREFDPAWTALHWVFGYLCNAGWCGHVSDLFARHNGAADHNAICVQTP